MADKQFTSCNVPEGVSYEPTMTDAKGQEITDKGDASKVAQAFVQLNNVDSTLFYTPEIKNDGTSVINGGRAKADGTVDTFKVADGVTSGPDYDKARQVLQELGVTCTGKNGLEAFEKAGVPLPNAKDLLNATRENGASL